MCVGVWVCIGWHLLRLGVLLNLYMSFVCPRYFAIVWFAAVVVVIIAAVVDVAAAPGLVCAFYGWKCN